MNSSDNNDELLFRLYHKLERLLADYAGDCEIVEDAEFDASGIEDAQAARQRQQSMAIQWRLVLRQMTQLSRHTKRGSLAKNRALQLCFKHHLAEDENVMELAKSHILHLDKFLDENGDSTLSKLPLDFSRENVSSEQE